ncbi:MAG TPA: GNAT family N-acetyltransferase, partial [Nitrospira sp.]|nr:GNAT family N-acetyltransferase [Nitrospira sp.]
LCAYADSYRAERGWNYVEMRSASALLDFGSRFDRAMIYHLHRLDLRASLDALRKGFHYDCIQRKIQRAERESLSYESGRSSRLIRQLYGLLQMTRFRHHLPPQPIEWFHQLMANMGKDACIRIASKEGRPIAGILTLDHRHTTFYKYGGSDERFHNLGGIPLLLWKTIQESKENAAEVLDLGRCDLDNPGLIAFKERWSALSSALATWRAPLMVTSPIAERRKLLLTRKVCAHLPDAVLKLAGRLLYRHIG